MTDHRTCRGCGATLGVVDIDAVVNCPICGVMNEVADDRAVALTEIETAAELRRTLAAVRSLAKTVAETEPSLGVEWFANQILEITEG